MRLSKDSIREIIVAFKEGESQAAIARRHQIDDSTVRYHVDKFETSYLHGSGVYSLIKADVQHECIHPSTVCSVCGKRHDTLMREERLKIRELEQRLARFKAPEESDTV